MGDSHDLGDLLRALRTAAGLTQEELAERTGLSGRGLQDIERGLRRRPHAETLRRLVTALGLDEAERAKLLAAAYGWPVRSSAPAALPAILTTFVGRERELAFVVSRLRDTRLLTLTGPGGIGKTRLAIETARTVADQYRDGVRLADLAPIADPGLVTRAVAEAFGVPEQRGRPVLDTLRDALGTREALLLLDNCEHLVQACAELVDGLLRSSPLLKVLVTSRELLGATGEATFQVPAMTVPERFSRVTAELARASDAIRLFVDRAELVRPGFALTDSTAPAIADICRRLDGMPLGIELAAARAGSMAVEQIAERLNDRFVLLTNGGRTVPRRHQTLRSAIDWSYGLLSRQEQVVLQRLAVFAGGFALEAAEAVCSGGPVDRADVLPCVLALVNKSLVIADVHVHQGRYRLLQTIREYAAERLQHDGETAPTRTRHRDWCLALAENAFRGVYGPDQHVWVRRLEAEHDNLRAAIEWSQADASDTQTQLRLCAALGRFWRWRHPAEGRTRLLGALTRADTAPTRARAVALDWAGVLEYFYGDLQHGRQLLQDAVDTARLVGDAHVLATAVRHLAAALGESLDGPAPELLQEALTIARAADDRDQIAETLMAQSIMARRGGEHSRADLLVREAMAMVRATGNPQLIAATLREAGQVAVARGNLRFARQAVEVALAAFALDEYGDHVVACRAELGDIERLSGDVERARARYLEALRASVELGLGFPSEMALVRLAGLEAACGSMHAAARLFAACRSVGSVSERWWGLPLTCERDLAAVKARLGEPEIACAWAEGQNMSAEQTVTYVLEGASEEALPLRGDIRTRRSARVR